MQYNLIPRELKLRVFNENLRQLRTYTFEEPTLWQLEYFWKYLAIGKNTKAIQSIGLNIPGDILEETIKTITQLIYGKMEGSGEKGFYPGNIDFCAKRYGCTPQEFMKQTTFSQLVTFFQGIEYNSNIEAGKPQNNNKFTREEITEKKLSEYENILAEVEEAEKKLKSK